MRALSQLLVVTIVLIFVFACLYANGAVPSAQELSDFAKFVEYVEECKEEGVQPTLPSGHIRILIEGEERVRLRGLAGTIFKGQGAGRWRFTKKKDDGRAIEPWATKKWHKANTVIEIVGGTRGIELLQAQRVVFQNITFIRRKGAAVTLHPSASDVTFEHCVFVGEGIGVECGLSLNNNLAAEVNFDTCHFEGLNKGTALRINNLQSVNHRFVACDFHHMRYVFDMQSGGNVTAIGCSGNGVKTLMRCRRSGKYLRPNLVAINLTLDNSGKNTTRFIESVGDSPKENLGGISVIIIGGKHNAHGGHKDLITYEHKRPIKLELMGFEHNGTKCNLVPHKVDPPETPNDVSRGQRDSSSDGAVTEGRPVFFQSCPNCNLKARRR